MPNGRKHKSTFRTNEPDKRLAQYKKVIERAINKYGNDKSKFIAELAQFMLAEVRNERKLMKELTSELESVYKDFTTDDS